MAARNKTVDRPSARNSSKSVGAGAEKKGSVSIVKKYWPVLFWIAFAILLYGFFLFNRNEVLANIAAVRNPTATQNAPLPPPVQETSIAPPAPLQETIPPYGDPSNEVVEAPSIEDQAINTDELPSSLDDTTAMQTEMQNRALHFTRVDRGGNILRIRVNRRLPVSASPLTDALNALISGPTTDEKATGLISLIPEGTELLSAAVRDGTAFLSLSEDFQYNIYGIDGYVGQLCEIVFTATEFSTVRDVQILIQGRRIDYLAEGIWIGSPLSRDTL